MYNKYKNRLHALKIEEESLLMNKGENETKMRNHLWRTKRVGEYVKDGRSEENKELKNKKQI